jgi:hypothetical protein
MVKIIFVLAVLGVSVAMPVHNVFAALCDTLSWLECTPTGPTSGIAILNLIESITDWIFAGFMILAVLMIVLAGWQFISSAGDPQSFAEARSKLFWALIAIVIAVFAKGIPVVLRSILGV